MTYKDEYIASTQHPDEFWLEQAQKLAWFQPPQKGCQPTDNGYFDWFRGGQLNTSYLALDHHVKNGRGDKTALIYDSPVTQTTQHFTYKELLNRVAEFAGGLSRLGVTKGDRVIIYMPMIPQAVIAMLACARLGAVHSVVFGGFAANELAVRIDDAKPVVIVTASCGIEGNKVLPYKPLVDEAISLAEHKPQACVLYQRPQLIAELNEATDHDWLSLWLKLACQLLLLPSMQLTRFMFFILQVQPVNPRGSFEIMAGTRLLFIIQWARFTVLVRTIFFGLHRMLVGWSVIHILSMARS